MLYLLRFLAVVPESLGKIWCKYNRTGERAVLLACHHYTTAHRTSAGLSGPSRLQCWTSDVLMEVGGSRDKAACTVKQDMRQICLRHFSGNLQDSRGNLERELSHCSFLPSTQKSSQPCTLPSSGFLVLFLSWLKQGLFKQSNPKKGPCRAGWSLTVSSSRQFSPGAEDKADPPRSNSLVLMVHFPSFLKGIYPRSSPTVY